MHDGTFATPGPGSWELETTHAQRPMSRWMASIFPGAMMRGFADSMRRYGALLDHMEVAVVDGFLYTCPRPVGAPKAAKGPPPKLIFKLLTWLHPELRRRVRRSAEVFERKLWREDVKRWDAELRPELVREHGALQAIDPRSLDDAGLAAHLETARARLERAIFIHHSMNAPCVVAVGDYLVQAREWTGFELAVLLEPLRGSSPASVGAVDELARLARALGADASAAARLAAGGAAQDKVTALAAWPGEVGAATTAYLDAFGHRIMGGYDASDPSLLELPGVAVSAIASALDRATAGVDGSVAATARIRAKVPAAQHAAFDELLAEARLVNRLRDDRALTGDCWCTGLCRRAILVAGERLARAGHLEAADHALDLKPEQLVGLLTGRGGPSAAETAGFYRWRTTKTVADAPARLGPPPGSPPPPEWLPAPAARLSRAVGLVVTQMFSSSRDRGEGKLVRGLAASAGVVEGRARVIGGPAEFVRVERGDVLVTRTTSPTYNVLLPIIAGIVTDRGGLLSHAAIVAREYGLPAVVGTNEGTKVIPDGARVRVDGGSGEVRILS